MIAKVISAFQTLVLVAALIGGGVVVYQGYQVYRAISDRIAKIDAWIDRFGDREKKWFGFESRIDKLELAELKRKQAGKPPPIEAAKLPISPTVIMYSIDGCGPCEQWWQEHADAWRKAGWAVRRETSTTSQPTPYWHVWDGTKWMVVAGKLDINTYRSAGGK